MITEEQQTEEEVIVDDQTQQGQVYDDVTSEEQTEQSEPETQEQQEEQTQPQGQPALQLAPEQFQELVNSIRPQAQAQPQQQQQERPQLTAEQIEQMFRPVRMTKDHLKAIGFEDATDEQVKGFQTILEATVQNAVATSRVIQLQKMQELEQQLEPVRQAYIRQEQRQLEDQFYGAYPGLKAYPQFVKVAAEQVKSTDANGNPRGLDDVMKEVSDQATALLKQVNPNIKLDGQSASPSAQQAKQPAGVPKPATPSQSGRSPQQSKTPNQNNPDADIYADW